MKTMIKSPQPICCSNCTAVTEQDVDRAREAGWLIGWRPEHPNWCPDCGGSERKKRGQYVQPYDEPMF